jgi:nicotinamidase-related amidase
MGQRGRPALLCIDNYNAVFGDRPEPVLEAMRRFPSSCGLAAWNALEPTQRVMAAARAAGIPVIHTTRDDATEAANSKTSSTKREVYGSDRDWNHAFFPPLAPQPGELVIRKTRASAFYGTALAAHLVQMDVNTLVCVGNSTSGCVRASVLEGYEHGYSMAVVEECVFDRNWLSHKVNLFDMNCKYADVLFVDEVLEYLARVQQPLAASVS